MYIHIYIYNKYIYKCKYVYIYIIDIIYIYTYILLKTKIIFIIKDAHRFKDSIACLEKYVRVFFFSSIFVFGRGGKLSIYFLVNIKYFGVDGVYCTIN